jgi:50S ribosomal protein 6
MAFVLRIECSSHPQKKATAHHNKSRPKKHQPYDKNRKGPTKYKRLPKPPPVWGFDTSDIEQAVTEVEASSEVVASSVPFLSFPCSSSSLLSRSFCCMEVESIV